jgi:hypothetical protein
MSRDRKFFGLIRFVSEFTRIERGERMRRGWGLAWDGFSSGRYGVWTAPVPFNWVIYWGLRLYYRLMNPRSFDRNPIRKVKS